MPARIEGYITIEASDYDDQLEIHADANDIYEIMECNSIGIEEVMECFDYQKPEIGLDDIQLYLNTVADHDDLAEVVSWCIKRFTSDFSATFNQMVDNRRDADQAKAEIKVLTATPVSDERRI